MEFLKKLNVWQKRGLASVLGGIAGYSYYFYIGCASGTCAITSNPYISTGYGMLVAAMLINKPTSDLKENENGNDKSTANQKV